MEVLLPRKLFVARPEASIVGVCENLATKSSGESSMMRDLLSLEGTTWPRQLDKTASPLLPSTRIFSPKDAPGAARRLCTYSAPPRDDGEPRTRERLGSKLATDKEQDRKHCGTPGKERGENAGGVSAGRGLECVAAILSPRAVREEDRCKMSPDLSDSSSRRSPLSLVDGAAEDSAWAWEDRCIPALDSVVAQTDLLLRRTS
ncbi:hypothetical protein ONZ51_g1901 [Trametes cubensis]|uniref:Uncharacterized protein n=1 Tax=Trametes cubensis TaxID=1111947 RepID=A0AAD7XFC5_9APHY|nr:hypothetical protein ONZ51_g1901 [Trametes cubensis]